MEASKQGHQDRGGGFGGLGMRRLEGQEPEKMVTVLSTRLGVS